MLIIGISKGMYGSDSCKIYVSENEFIWEYKWFYDKDDQVHLLATEYKTGKTLQSPLKNFEMNSEIIEILEDASRKI